MFKLAGGTVCESCNHTFIRHTESGFFNPTLDFAANACLALNCSCEKFILAGVIDIPEQEFSDFKPLKTNLFENNSADIPEPEMVEHPAHYNSGKIEVWDFIIDQGLPYCLGDAVKYICRTGKKDSAKQVQDLEKAKQYIDREIRRIKEEELEDIREQNLAAIKHELTLSLYRNGREAMDEYING